MGFDIVLIKCGVDNELEFDFFVSKLLSCRPGSYVIILVRAYYIYTRGLGTPTSESA